MLMQIIDFPNTLFTKFGQINIETAHRAPIEHRRIIQALKARDQDWASMEMRAHDEAIRRGQRKLGEVFKKTRLNCRRRNCNYYDANR